MASNSLSAREQVGYLLAVTVGSTPQSARRQTGLGGPPNERQRLQERKVRELGHEDREAIAESYRLVIRAFQDAEKGVRQEGVGAVLEVVRSQALANELINVLRKHLGLIR
jgi:hypothetical protein